MKRTLDIGVPVCPTVVPVLASAEVAGTAASTSPAPASAHAVTATLNTFMRPAPFPERPAALLSGT
jgi:hypothetical protein